MSDETIAPSIPQASFLAIAMDVLSDKLFRYSFRWVTMLASAGLFGWTVWQPHWIRLVGAVAFTMLVTVPTLWRQT